MSSLTTYKIISLKAFNLKIEKINIILQLYIYKINMATFSLSEYILTKEQINSIYSILTVSHPKIEEQYGAISIVKVILNNKEASTLVIIPGYSASSFMSGFESIMDGFDSYKNKYSIMYAVYWGPTVKTITDEYAKSVETIKKNNIN